MLHSFVSPLLVVVAVLNCIFPCSLTAPLHGGQSCGPLLIDVFDRQDLNALGQYHRGSGFGDIQGEQQLTIATDEVDGWPHTPNTASGFL